MTSSAAWFLMVQMLTTTLKWGFLFALCYPLGCVAFVTSNVVNNHMTAREAEALMGKLNRGMTPAQVEAIMERPFEFRVQYASNYGVEHFSHNWNVNEHRVEVIFANGQASEWHRFSPDASPTQRFFGWVFFWWLMAID